MHGTTPPQREARDARVWQLHVEGIRSDVIGARLGLSSSAVRTILRNVRRRLKAAAEAGSRDTGRVAEAGGE